MVTSVVPWEGISKMISCSRRILESVEGSVYGGSKNRELIDEIADLTNKFKHVADKEKKTYTNFIAIQSFSFLADCE